MAHITSITEADVLDYVKSLEEFHHCMVVIQLGVGGQRMSGKWVLEARAYQVHPDGARQLVTGAVACYPSRHHKTFAGALMNACFSLEERLSAQIVLSQLPRPGE